MEGGQQLLYQGLILFVHGGTLVSIINRQTKAPTAEKPSFGVCKRLDFELEIGAILGGPGNRLGEPIKVD
jgi:hypothetical protein